VQYSVGIFTSMLLIYIDGMEHHHEEFLVWFSMTFILCIYINVLISVLETSNDQVVFVFVNWYSSVLKTELSEALLWDRVS
jgi:hypothetical protein